jgi:hypothetical protein
MGDPKAWDTWNELEEAQRVEPDPERLDEFISIQLNQDAHDRIARALHGRQEPRQMGVICGDAWALRAADARI